MYRVPGYSQVMPSSLRPGTRVTAPLGRAGTVDSLNARTGRVVVILDEDPARPTSFHPAVLLAVRPVQGETGGRQAKVARIVNTLDTERSRSAHDWPEVVRMLDALRVAAAEAAPIPDGSNDYQACAIRQAAGETAEHTWWSLVAARAGVREPSHETTRLCRVHVETLARWHDDPFAGLPR